MPTLSLADLTNLGFNTFQFHHRHQPLKKLAEVRKISQKLAMVSAVSDLVQALILMHQIGAPPNQSGAQSK
jgi:hypothetical protein